VEPVKTYTAEESGFYVTVHCGIFTVLPYVLQYVTTSTIAEKTQNFT